MNDVVCTNCNNEFPLSRTFADGNNIYGVCPHCGASVAADVEVELTGEQADRCDEVYDAVYEMCKVLVEDPELEWDMAYFGEIADIAAHIMVVHGKRVHFPSVITEQDESQYIEEYYEPDKCEPERNNKKS